MLSQIGLILLTSFLMFLGLAGSILPLLPGPPLAYGGLLLYAYLTDFADVTVTALVIFGVLTAFSLILDALAPVLGAKGYKASTSGMVGAFVGTVVGIFILGPIGILLGPVIGAFAGEYFANRDHERALKISWGAFVGFLVGSMAKVVVVLAMIGYFVVTLI